MSPDEMTVTVRHKVKWKGDEWVQEEMFPLSRVTHRDLHKMPCDKQRVVKTNVFRLKSFWS